MTIKHKNNAFLKQSRYSFTRKLFDIQAQIHLTIYLVTLSPQSTAI